MASVKIYGTAGSRAFRSLWAAVEMQLDFEHVPTNFRGENKAPEYLAINPNGRIPAMVDGDLVLFESMAINLYLAKQYGPSLVPADPAAEAKVVQWSVWGISEIEPLQMQIVVQRFFTAKEQQDVEIIEQATKGLQRPLAVLDSVLADTPYLLGSEFSLADVNVAGVMDLLSSLRFDFSAQPNVGLWLERCQSRPSYAKTKALAS